MAQTQHKTFDVLLLLKDSGAVTATGVGQVAAANKILDLGSDAEVHGEMLVDVAAIDIVSNDESYNIVLSGSSSATFASDIEPLAELSLGALEVIPGDVDSTVGRYRVPFSNRREARTYRYLRVEHVISGTTPSIDYTAYLAKH